MWVLSLPRLGAETNEISRTPAGGVFVSFSCVVVQSSLLTHGVLGPGCCSTLQVFEGLLTAF